MGKVKIGNFKGPQGETGPQGPAGPQGPEGPQGPMGEVDANTQIVFTQAASRENIASGEKLNIILGKIRKWFADIKGAAFQDVSNTLTTTEAGKVLDARQGKVLDEKVTEKVDKTDVVNGLTETAAGKVLDARQGKVLDEKIDDLSREVSDLNSKLNPKSYDISSINLKSAWEVRYSDIHKIGRLVIFHARIYAETILALHEYTINTEIDSDLIPVSDTPISAIAGDIYMQHTVACKCTIYKDGLIKLEVPDSGKNYVDISCVYTT